MADTKDIELTLEDIKEMDPAGVLNMYNRQRALAAKYRDRIPTLQEENSDLREQLGRAWQFSRDMQHDIARRNAALAEYGMRVLEKEPTDAS